MKHIKLKDILSEIAGNEPATNPSYLDVKVGDRYVSPHVNRFRNHVWIYVSTVLEVEEVKQRFGKDDRIVSVKVEAYDLQRGEVTSVVDHKKKIWVSQLLQGLV